MISSFTLTILKERSTMSARVQIIKRKPYHGKRVRVEKDPFIHFGKWFREAVKAVPEEPNVMALATVGKNRKPSVRMVLLKSFDKRGFTFFTNYESRKARELKVNPYASICFYWAQLNLQIRIEGKIKFVSDAESIAYFKTRPRGSQIAATISRQSWLLSNYRDLARAFNAFERSLKGKAVPKPKNWGGYCLEPTEFEFWSGQPSRLHERIVYKKTSRGWKIERLYP